MSNADELALPSSVALRLKEVSHSFSGNTSEEKDFGERFILKDVSLELVRGEVLGVIGRNGVGKTTLLRLMAGILAPTSGQILISKGAKCALLSLGLGFQAQLSGRDNARLSAMLQGCSAAEASSVLGDIADFSELGRSFDEPVKTYSTGMRSRLGFATSLYTAVDILLIDEVLAVGDAKFREKAGQALESRILGNQTVVFVSHAEQQVRQLCTRAVLLDEGRLTIDSTPDEVFKIYGEKLNK
ncbi:MAG: ABC transporter ATP-binding protein [Pseudomonadota bacterium]